MNKKGSFLKDLTLKVSIVFVLLQSIGVILFVLSSPDLLKDALYIILYEALSLVILLIILKNLFKRYLSGFDEIVSRLKRGDLHSIPEEGEYMEIDDLRDSINSLLGHIKDIIGRTSDGLRKAITEMRKITPSFEGLGSDIRRQAELIKKIGESIKKIESPMREIIDSDQNLSILSEENISALTEITSSGREIEESTKQLSGFSNNIHSLIVDISRAANEIAKNMENLSVSVEQTSAAVDELTASFKEIERSTKESAGLTKDVRHFAADGMNIVADAIDGMEIITRSVNRNVEMIKNLAEKSAEIEKILSVISDITKKTNLLSLNAAILSSQAGEEGKVFSVVADEIKVLADKTRSSAKDITEIIHSIQKDIEATLKASEESIQVVESGTDLVVKIGGALREVINTARQSADVAGNIQKATHEQVTGISQINKAMEVIKISLEDITKATFMQEKGSSNILTISEKIKEISSNLARGIGDQNIGVQMILTNTHVVSEKIKHINNGAEEYKQSSQELFAIIDDLNRLNNELSKAIQDTGNASKNLYKETAGYLKALEGFISE